MCFPKSNHKTLIDSCFPPPKALGGSGPEYKANSNELSRLAYYANSKPAKLTKVFSNLSDKANAFAKGLAGATGAKADNNKGGLMLTLAIVKSLVTDCKSHLSYFASSAQDIVHQSIVSAAAGPGPAANRRDLDISTRSASTFYAIANYIDPATANADGRYQGLIKQFARVATEQTNDKEDTSRIRLIGLGALAGAVGSDALYTSSFKEQTNIIVPALLANLLESDAVNLDYLRSEAAKAAQGSPSFAEYNAKRRPIASRRTPSLSGTAATEKTYTAKDAASSAISTLQGLLHNADASHVQIIASAVITYLDGTTAWSKCSVPWCVWLAEALTSWTAQPYRFLILNALLENLVETEASSPSPPSGDSSSRKSETLLVMISGLLRSKLSLIGLSTSDTISNLLGLAVRRTHANPDDALLPALIDCIGAVGTHTYYADQATDSADEICARIGALLLSSADADGLAAASAAKTSTGAQLAPHQPRRPIKTSDRARDVSIRVLLCALASLTDAANAYPSKASAGGTGVGTARSRISPDVLAPTCALLISPNPRVRTTFHQTVLYFLEREAGPGSDTLPSAHEAQQKESASFVHAWSAGAFVLALSKTLFLPGASGVGSSTASASGSAAGAPKFESPLGYLPIIDRANVEGTKLPNQESAATPLDYSALTAISEKLIQYLPIPATLGLVPALLKLDKDVRSRLSGGAAESERAAATSSFIGKSFSTLASAWDAPKAGVSTSSASLPLFPVQQPDLDSIPDAGNFKGMSSSGSASSVNASSIVDALSKSSKLQEDSRLSQQELADWLSRDWSVSIAVDDALIGASPFRSSLDGSSVPRPFEGVRGGEAASAVLPTSAEQPRGVGVDDFRAALGSRSYGSGGGGASIGGNRATSRSGSSAPPSAANNLTGSNSLTGLGSADGSAAGRGALAERRTSRRVSRKELNPAAAGRDVGKILDGLHIGTADESLEDPYTVKSKKAHDGDTRLVAPVLS
ncbi:hypothetical protein IE81DRAFT_56863 [Ceraceosorus guamensis]|uniref:Protein EFR3 n=1 Tax=Ceraceosorus guamensis TaxID=1522189 RepID=A0A316VS79_9BASI|nr:hypothetical protein IE81DRAFT_56863 [Ceraceosorus guamensis]PWN39041.1 hypothetical protein IE81DRAFT_56863 [Ceraceosorus guamensis]